MEPLVRVTRGVWRPESQLTDLPGRVAAVLAGCPADTVVGGVTAARLHGLWLPPHLLDESSPIEVVVHRSVPAPRDRCGSRRRELRARRQRLTDEDVTTVAGIPVVTQAKAWLDLSSRLLEPDLVALGDSVLRGTTSLIDLGTAVERARHCRGVVRARAVLPLLDAASRSRPESHLRHALVSRGLPTPRVNVAIHDDTGQWLAEPDLSYEDGKLALEYQGAEHADLDRMRKDITRAADVDLRGGWLMLLFGPVEVFRRPDQVALRVRRHLQERSGRDRLTA